MQLGEAGFAVQIPSSDAHSVLPFFDHLFLPYQTDKSSRMIGELPCLLEVGAIETPGPVELWLSLVTRRTGYAALKLLFFKVCP